MANLAAPHSTATESAFAVKGNRLLQQNLPIAVVSICNKVLCAYRTNQTGVSTPFVHNGIQR
jgi:hypothetical protein